MVTSEAIRSSEPRRAAPTITWPQTVTVRDVDGAYLSDALVSAVQQGGRLVLDDVVEPSALLDYYFGQGGRQIMLSLDGAPAEGWLETRWEGCRRSWWLELDEGASGYPI